MSFAYVSSYFSLQLDVDSFLASFIQFFVFMTIFVFSVSSHVFVT